MNAPIDVTNIRIETTRLILRPWQESDLADFYEYARVEGVGEMEYAPTSADSMNPELLDPLSFDENALFAPDGTDDLKNRKEIGVKTSAFATKEVVHEQVKYIEIPSKKITEIRIFFDNGTYETFRPEK